MADRVGDGDCDGDGADDRSIGLFLLFRWLVCTGIPSMRVFAVTCRWCAVCRYITRYLPSRSAQFAIA